MPIPRIKLNGSTKCCGRTYQLPAQRCEICSERLVYRAASDCVCGIDADPTGTLPRLDIVCPKHDGEFLVKAELSR